MIRFCIEINKIYKYVDIFYQKNVNGDDGSVYWECMLYDIFTVWFFHFDTTINLYFSLYFKSQVNDVSKWRKHKVLSECDKAVNALLMCVIGLKVLCT